VRFQVLGEYEDESLLGYCAV